MLWIFSAQMECIYQVRTSKLKTSRSWKSSISQSLSLRMLTFAWHITKILRSGRTPITIVYLQWNAKFQYYELSSAGVYIWWRGMRTANGTDGNQQLNTTSRPHVRHAVCCLNIILLLLLLLSQPKIILNWPERFRDPLSCHCYRCWWHLCRSCSRSEQYKSLENCVIFFL